MNYLVSIITPSYNCEKTILGTYYSLRNQSHSNWEWLITDDCSSDNTLDIINQIIDKDPKVKIFRNSVNSGAAISRNNSIKKATGDFLAFIDSDDIWLPNKLYQQIKFMEENDVDFSFTAYELINENGRKLGQKVDTHLTSSVSYDDMLKKRATLGCSTVMLRQRTFSDIAMPLLRTGQDYATWLSILKTGKNAFPLTDVLTQYRILPNSISRNKIKKAKRQWQIYREVENLSLTKSVICFCFYAWRAVFRK